MNAGRNTDGLKLAEGRAKTEKSAHNAVIAATIGNMMETYDFAVYGYFALILSRLFFPAGDETVSLLLTVATFGVGFFARPIGAVVLGTLADRRGRKFTLSLTIFLMALGTVLIGVAPTYATIGVYAPATIVLARLLQGFSAGGELGTATAFLVEQAPPAQRGFFGSWQQASQALALLLGSLLGAGITEVLTPAQLEAWGWRIPFLLGILIGPVGYYIRRHTNEARDYGSLPQGRAESPLKLTLGRHRRNILSGFGITITWTVCTYFFLIFMPTYAVRQLGISQSNAFFANSVALVVLMVLAPPFGALSDRIGRRSLLLATSITIALLAYPLLWLLGTVKTTASLVAFQLFFAVLIAAFTGGAPAALAEVYPNEVRSTGVSIAYNLATTIFGGFAPFIAVWLISWTGQPLAPAWYVTAAVILSSSIVFGTYQREKRGSEPAHAENERRFA
jgi:MFS transporter, MHS family, proline/betaine transporter